MSEEPDTLRPASGSFGFVGSGSVTLSIRSNLAHRHLTSARLFAAGSGKIEGEYVTIRSGAVEGGGLQEYSKYWQEHRGEHWAYVVGAVLSSVAFLEGLINELFLDAVDYEGSDPKPEAPHPSNPIHPLPARARELMAQMWPILEKRGVLDKFHAALVLAGKEPFNPGVSALHKAVRVLIELRNNLVHYKPEWSSGDPAEYSNLEKRLRGQGFPLNPVFDGTGNPFFPDKCLSHAWASHLSTGVYWRPSLRCLF
jgi:hypothetical protein